MASMVDSHFKSALPPRKRAKTDEEKEQRRVERILRNRRAAHASREKKRKHVEYLEAYVLALEANMSVMESNVQKLTDSIPKDSMPLDLDTPEDLSDLKAKIHSNMSCTGINESSVQTMDLFDSCNQSTMSSLSDEMEDNDLTSKLSSGEVKVKIEGTDEFELSNAHQTQSYFNYLSPVSNNSSPNSPLDLTVKQDSISPEASISESFSLSAMSGPEYMAQNPAVILSPKVLANWFVLPMSSSS